MDAKELSLSELIKAIVARASVKELTMGIDKNKTLREVAELILENCTDMQDDAGCPLCGR